MKKTFFSLMVLGALVALPMAHADWSDWGDGDGWGNSDGQVSCIVSVDQNTYQGTGYDVGSALAQARDNCIYDLNNSRICVSAPYSCFQPY